MAFLFDDLQLQPLTLGHSGKCCTLSDYGLPAFLICLIWNSFRDIADILRKEIIVWANVTFITMMTPIFN